MNKEVVFSKLKETINDMEQYFNNKPIILEKAEANKDLISEEYCNGEFIKNYVFTINVVYKEIENEE